MSIATIQDLIKSGARTARAACRCGRDETLDLPSLAAAHGETTQFMYIRGRLVCRGCGARGQVTTSVEYPITMGLGQVSNQGVSR
jgi:hypothetical protein